MASNDCPDEMHCLQWEDGYAQRLADELERFRMTASHVAHTLSLKDDNVLCVFLVGSRLWGTSGHQSDFDFIVVTSKLVWGGEKPADRHVGLIDAHILSRDQFEAGLEEQRFRYLLCLHLPCTCVLRSLWTPKFALNVRLLHSTFLNEKERDLRMARKYFEKGERQRACKTLVHTYRMLLLGKELLSTGAITSFGAGRDKHNQLCWCLPKAWSDLEEFARGPIADAEEQFCTCPTQIK